MKKLLAAIAVVIIIALVLLWRELDSSSAAAPAASATPAAPTHVASAPAATPEVQPAAPAPAAGEPASAKDPSTEKMDPQSDEFFYQHDEIVVPMMMRQAVKCWENLPPAKRAEFHRNQSLVAKFKQRIRNGVVTVHDLVVERSSINDPALEACFVQHLRDTTWSNPRLPDWDQEDTIKLGPRTLKKYTRENIEADGPEQPVD